MRENMSEESNEWMEALEEVVGKGLRVNSMEEFALQRAGTLSF